MNNRDGLMGDYTGMTAQRRHRRRTDTEPAFPDRGAGNAEFGRTEIAEEEAPDLSGWSTAEKETTVPRKTVDRTAYMRPAPEQKPEQPEEEPAEDPEEKPEQTGEEKLSTAQSADSRVPPEARRMAAAPYGTARAGAKRPGTRPVSAPARPSAPERQPAARRPERVQAGQPATQEGREKPARVRVGYAPGRMSEDMTRKLPSADREQESVYTREARAYLERRSQPFRTKEPEGAAPDKPVNRLVRRIVAALLVLGFALAGVLFLRDKNGGGKPKPQTDNSVISFTTNGTQGQTAPAAVTFMVVTEKNVTGIRLTDEDGRDTGAMAEGADNAAGKAWLLTLNVREGFDGTVRLELMKDGSEEWTKTDYITEVLVRSVVVSAAPGAQESLTTEPPARNGEVTFNETDGETGQEPASTPAPPDEDETWPEDGEDEPEDGEMPEEGYEPEEGEDERVIGELRTAPPTYTPEPEKEKPTETPPLTAEAAAESNPDLIGSTVVYNGNKKEKTYSRPAKYLVHMPVGDEYTTKLLGVMTFRGDSFRRNAAVGSLPANAQELKVIWEVEAGSSRGASQVYYGYGWPGQPAIARWSKQVRGSSNLYDSKQAQEKLKEVIIAGLDGNIRFLDLEDGSLTRNSIKLGYPMRGTPSLDTKGAPFISVGQFARKMKGKTGRIGLRQYNLYSQKELKLIDGLDGKQHRPLNDIGSFNTSALIDRNSDTLIIAGSNGVLYLEALDPTFDYNAGVLTVSPSVTMMVSKVKGQKNTALAAVESSLAAYDKYVFYADMGGVLRCVDTNTLMPVWAVETGDAVMAAVALDLTEDRELNLYTANMLANRKKGSSDIQIRRYDALTGKQAWSTDIGVYKGKKDKLDVGAKASPVIGQHGLSELVFFTVTGLSEAGREQLGTGASDQAALIALSKDSGKVVWTLGLSSRSESSPVAVYDESGNGWIIQCEQNGTIHLVDGLTGSEINTLKLDAEIEASPAVYNDIMVIGTTGKGTAFVYGIQIWTPESREPTAERKSEDE